MGRPKKAPTGAELILKERKQHLSKHKISVKKDRAVNCFGQLRLAAARLLSKGPGRTAPPYRWSKEKWAKILKKSEKEKLIIAGSLIAAEIDMLIAEEEEAKKASKEE